MLNESGYRTEVVENQEQQETEEVAEISTLLGSISVSEDLKTGIKKIIWRNR